MLEPTHAPNKLEITLTIICLFIAAILTGIVFPLIISTDKLSLIAILGLSIFIFLMILLFVQTVFNFYYLRYQRKKKNEKG